MALTCFKDYVFPFYGCFAMSGAPQSGLYLTNLPGIQFKTIDQISDEDQVSWQGVWNDIQTRAMTNFEDDINNEFQKRYLLNQVLQSVDLGAQYDTTILTPNLNGSGVTNGILVETYFPGSQFGCSTLQGLYFQSFNFYYYDAVTSASTLTLTIYDADLQTTLYQTTLSGNSIQTGWNQIIVEQGFSAKRAFAAFTGTFTQYVNLDLTNFLLNNFGGNMGGGWWDSTLNSAMYDAWGTGCQARINGTTLTNGNWVDLTNNIGLNGFGTSMVFSLRCSFGNFICSNKNLFASSWLLRLGIEFLDELKWSSRLNRWTTIDASKFEALQSLLMLQYHGGDSPNMKAAEFGLKVLRTEAGKLPQAIRGIVLNPYDGCLSCNDHFMYAESRM